MDDRALDGRSVLEEPRTILRVWLAVSLSGALSLAAGSARAQGNDRSAPTGGRTALMGNTGIALGQDGASPFMNPATIVGIHDNSFAFSVNFYSFQDTHFSNWHQPSGNVDAGHFGTVSLNGTDISSNGFNALPSTLCLFFTTAGQNMDGDLAGTFRGGRQKLALCFGTLESQGTNLSALGFNGATSAGTTAQVQSVATSFNRAQVGPTYSIAFNDHFAAGLSLHGAFTTESYSLQSNTITSEVGGGAAQSSLGTGGGGHSVDLTAILGLSYQQGPVAIGLSGQLPSLHALGGFNGVLHNTYADGTTNSATLTNATGTFSAPPPIRIGLGAALHVPKLLAEADVSYDFGWNSAFSTTTSGTTTTLKAGALTNTALSATYTIPTQGVLNVAGGAEYFLAPEFSLIGGLSTNLTSLPGLSPTMTVGNLAPTRTSWINAAFGIGSYSNTGSLLVGAVLGFGWGEALAMNPYVLPNQWAVVDTQSYSALLVLAGNVNFKTVGKAVREVESVVKTGNPEAPATKPPKRAPAPVEVPPVTTPPVVVPPAVVPTPPVPVPAPHAAAAPPTRTLVPAPDSSTELKNRGVDQDGAR